MKRPSLKLLPVISALLLLLPISCEKQPEGPEQPDPRELSIPEKVEKEILDILSRDWKSLSDTLAYFDSTMLSKGKLKGIGPDGVSYELKISAKLTSGIDASFLIEDTVRISVSGKILPIEVTVSAYDTEIAVKSRLDSTTLSVSDVTAVFPKGFIIMTGKTAPLFYKGTEVGYIDRERYENPDYSTGIYLTIHYYDDPRTFALYDNGLGELVKKSLSGVTE